MLIAALNFHAVVGQYFHSPIRCRSSILHTIVWWSRPRWWLILDELTFIMRLHHKIIAVGPTKTPWFSSILGHISSEYLLAYIDITVSIFCKVQSLPSIVEIPENAEHGQDLPMLSYLFKYAPWESYTSCIHAIRFNHDSSDYRCHDLLADHVNCITEM